MTATVIASKPAVDLTPRRSRRPMTIGHAAPWIFATLTFILILAVLRGRGQLVRVPVAASTINAGERVSASNVRMVTMHADDSGARAGLLTLADLHSSQNLVAAVLIHSGDPITRSEIVRSAGPTGLASMSLPVPVAHANGGSIVVGDRVDVIGHGTGVAEYVARGLQVLAVAPASSSSGLGASTSNSTFYIVVAVDSDTALRLSQALGNSNTGGAVDVIRTTGVPNDQQPTPTILSPLATSAGSTSHPPTTQAGR